MSNTENQSMQEHVYEKAIREIIVLLPAPVRCYAAQALGLVFYETYKNITVYLSACQ